MPILQLAGPASKCALATRNGAGALMRWGAAARLRAMLEASFARRFFWLRLLRGSLVAAALYDFGFAVLMSVAPELPARWFRLPLPGETFYLRLIATLLAMLACLYLAAARDPRRYSAIIAVAIIGRLGGALLFAYSAWGRPDLAGLWSMAAADFALALAHAVAWAPLRT